MNATAQQTEPNTHEMVVIQDLPPGVPAARRDRPAHLGRRYPPGRAHRQAHRVLPRRPA